MKLKVKITPSSSRNQILGWRGDTLKISIQAAPENGKANKALLRFLAQSWNIKPSDIELISGESNALKLLEIPLDKEAINTLLS